jgi:hypothetical protein
MANYLLDIVILLAAGAVPGFLVAGVLAGPSGLALIDTAEELIPNFRDSHFARIRARKNNL